VAETKLNKYVLETAVFTCGAVVMIYELVGSRVLGPYFGTSIFVWTGLIGVILGSLSLGYFFGGKLADKKPNIEILSGLILLSAVFICLTLFIKDPLLTVLQKNFADIKVGSVLASLIIFLPASILLGMVSPYAAKIRIVDVSKSGSAVGNLSAISTLGSIVGTFLSGFYLIPHFGTNNLLIILCAVLTVVSLLLTVDHFLKIKLAALVVIGLCWISVRGVNAAWAKNGFIDVDTAYNRIWIYVYKDDAGKTVRRMSVNNENHSSMYLDSDELVNEYTKYYHLAAHFNPNFKKTAMLGGAGYSFPKDFLLKYPSSTMDVVEIDPMVTELAREYFNLQDSPRLTIKHQDGRVFLNTTQEKYDVIFGDAFSSHYSLPYQLTTEEAVQKHYDILNDGGVAIVNIVSAIDGDRGLFLRAEYATYKKIFPQVYLFPVNQPDDGTSVQNIMLVAVKSSKRTSFQDSDPTLDSFLKHLWTKEVKDNVPILTDDFAPVDYYIGKAI